MGFKKVEDRPTPQSVYNFRVYSCAMIAACAAIMIGYDSAFIGTSLNFASFKAEFGFDQLSTARYGFIKENIVSCYQAGAIAGSLLAYPGGILLGRKWGLLVASLFLNLGAGIMLIANGSRGYDSILAGRFVNGMGIGMASNLTPLYISEISPPAIRGQLVGMFEIGWQIGGLVGFWINFGVNKHMAPTFRQWIVPVAVQLIPGGMLFIGCWFLVESPRWLVSRNRRDEAIRNLTILRKLEADTPYLIEELNMIDLQTEHDRTAVGVGFWAPVRQLFTTWRLLRRVLIVASLFLWQNGTGINAVNYYSPTIFASLGVTGTSTSLLTTGVFGVIKTVGSLVWAFFLIDRFGRRILLLCGAALGAISMLYIGGFIAVGKPQLITDGSMGPGGRAALGMFYIWTASYSLSWNGTPWVVCAESFPGSVRLVAQTMAATSNWLWNFLISRFTSQMFAGMGAGGFGVYIFFGLMQVISIPYIVLLLPETKQVPLEEMDRLWVCKNTWRANSIVMAELQRERAAVDGPVEKLQLEKPAAGAEEGEFVEQAAAPAVKRDLTV